MSKAVTESLCGFTRVCEHKTSFNRIFNVNKPSAEKWVCVQEHTRPQRCSESRVLSTKVGLILVEGSCTADKKAFKSKEKRGHAHTVPSKNTNGRSVKCQHVFLIPLMSALTQKLQTGDRAEDQPDPSQKECECVMWWFYNQLTNWQEASEWLKL